MSGLFCIAKIGRQKKNYFLNFMDFKPLQQTRNKKIELQFAMQQKQVKAKLPVENADI